MKKKIRILDLEICLDNLNGGGGGVGGVYNGCVLRDWSTIEIFVHRWGKQNIEWECVSACAPLNLFFSEHFLPQVAHVYS